MLNASEAQTKTTKRSLPKGWRWVKLGNISLVISKGTTPTSLGHKYTNAGIPFLRAEDVNSGVIDVSQVAFHISEETNDLLARSQLQPNDFLVTIAGTLGRVGYVPSEVTRLNCNQAVAFVRFIENTVDVNFVCYACQNPDIIQNLIGLKVGGGIQNLSLEQIKNFEIPLPPLNEQRRIAKRLNEQMAAVESARRAAEEQLQAARRLPSAYLREVFDKIEQKLPPGWHWIRLGDICHFKRGPFGGSLKKDIFVASGYKVYEQQHAIQDDFEIGRYYITEEKYREMEIFAIKPNDLLMSCSGTMGRLAIVPQNAKPGIINQALLKLTPKVEKVSPSYLRAYLQSETVQKTYIHGAAGTAIQNVAPVSELKEINIPLPPIKEQNTLVNALQEKYQFSNSLIASLESQLAETNRLPASLLREGFAGRV